MIKLTILYRKLESVADFEEFYSANLALMERLPRVIRRQAGLVVGAPGGESPYYRVLELYFEDLDSLESAMRGPEGEAAGRHLIEHAAALVEMYFADVYEEPGGATPT